MAITGINYIQNGERACEDVLNRPVKDLVAFLESKGIDIPNDANINDLINRLIKEFLTNKGYNPDDLNLDEFVNNLIKSFLSNEDYDADATNFVDFVNNLIQTYMDNNPIDVVGKSLFDANKALYSGETPLNYPTNFDEKTSIRNSKRLSPIRRDDNGKILIYDDTFDRVINVSGINYVLSKKNINNNFNDTNFKYNTDESASDENIYASISIKDTFNIDEEYQYIADDYITYYGDFTNIKNYFDNNKISYDTTIKLAIYELSADGSQSSLIFKYNSLNYFLNNPIKNIFEAVPDKIITYVYAYYNSTIVGINPSFTKEIYQYNKLLIKTYPKNLINSDNYIIYPFGDKKYKGDAIDGISASLKGYTIKYYDFRDLTKDDINLLLKDNRHNFYKDKDGNYYQYQFELLMDNATYGEDLKDIFNNTLTEINGVSVKYNPNGYYEDNDGNKYYIIGLYKNNKNFASYHPIYNPYGINYYDDNKDYFTTSSSNKDNKDFIFKLKDKLNTNLLNDAKKIDFMVDFIDLRKSAVEKENIVEDYFSYGLKLVTQDSENIEYFLAGKKRPITKNICDISSYNYSEGSSLFNKTDLIYTYTIDKNNIKTKDDLKVGIYILNRFFEEKIMFKINDLVFKKIENGTYIGLNKACIKNNGKNMLINLNDKNISDQNIFVFSNNNLDSFLPLYVTFYDDILYVKNVLYVTNEPIREYILNGTKYNTFGTDVNNILETDDYSAIVGDTNQDNLILLGEYVTIYHTKNYDRFIPLFDFQVNEYNYHKEKDIIDVEIFYKKEEIINFLENNYKVTLDAQNANIKTPYYRKGSDGKFYHLLKDTITPPDNTIVTMYSDRYYINNQGVWHHWNDDTDISSNLSSSGDWVLLYENIVYDSGNNKLIILNDDGTIDKELSNISAIYTKLDGSKIYVLSQNELHIDFSYKDNIIDLTGQYIAYIDFMYDKVYSIKGDRSIYLNGNLMAYNADLYKKILYFIYKNDMSNPFVKDMLTFEGGSFMFESLYYNYKGLANIRFNIYDEENNPLFNAKEIDFKTLAKI